MSALDKLDGWIDAHVAAADVAVGHALVDAARTEAAPRTVTTVEAELVDVAELLIQHAVEMDKSTVYREGRADGMTYAATLLFRKADKGTEPTP